MEEESKANTDKLHNVYYENVIVHINKLQNKQMQTKKAFYQYWDIMNDTSLRNQKWINSWHERKLRARSEWQPKDTAAMNAELTNIQCCKNKYACSNQVGMADKSANLFKERDKVIKEKLTNYTRSCIQFKNWWLNKSDRQKDMQADT